MTFKKRYKMTEEHKRKIGNANREKIRTAEENENNRQWHLGRKHSKETRMKMSLVKKGKTPKNIEQIKGWNRGKISKTKSNYTRISHNSWCIDNQLPYVPKGYVIHHCDFNPINNNPNNLVLMDRKSHVQYHMEINKLMNKGLITP